MSSLLLSSLFSLHILLLFLYRHFFLRICTLLYCNNYISFFISTLRFTLRRDLIERKKEREKREEKRNKAGLVTLRASQMRSRNDDGCLKYTISNALLRIAKKKVTDDRLLFPHRNLSPYMFFFSFSERNSTEVITLLCVRISEF